MTIFPDEYKAFKCINNNNRINAEIYLYSEKELLFSGKIENITSEKFEKLQTFLEVLVGINKDTTTPTRLGIVEVQWFLRGFM